MGGDAGAALGEEGEAGALLGVLCSRWLELAPPLRNLLGGLFCKEVHDAVLSTYLQWAPPSRRRWQSELCTGIATCARSIALLTA